MEAASLADGRVLVIGSDGDPDHTSDRAEVFDPKTGIFTPTGPMVGAGREASTFRPRDWPTVVS
jgi:hypothetical protein